MDFIVEKTKVLAIEGSAYMRLEFKKIFESDPSILFSFAKGIEEGFSKLKEYKPDVITFDLNLSGVNTISIVKTILSEHKAPLIVVSMLTMEGAMHTFEALELGAFDCITKPMGALTILTKNVGKEILEKVKVAGRSGHMSSLRKNLSYTTQTSLPKTPPKKTIQIYNDDNPYKKKVTKAVAIGISTGGPKVLMDIIPALPKNLGAAIFLVQHIPAHFTKSFSVRLNSFSPLNVKEAESGELVEEDTIYVGKGGYQLCLKRGYDGNTYINLTDEKFNFFKPSVTVMMESMLQIYGKKTVGVLMTGMGDDGADAMVKIRKAGGITIAESQETAIVFGMPKEAIQRGGAEIVVPSYKIIEEIVKAVKRIL